MQSQCIPHPPWSGYPQKSEPISSYGCGSRSCELALQGVWDDAIKLSRALKIVQNHITEQDFLISSVVASTNELCADFGIPRRLEAPKAGTVRAVLGRVQELMSKYCSLPAPTIRPQLPPPPYQLPETNKAAWKEIPSQLATTSRYTSSSIATLNQTSHKVDISKLLPPPQLPFEPVCSRHLPLPTPCIPSSQPNTAGPLLHKWGVITAQQNGVPLERAGSCMVPPTNILPSSMHDNKRPRYSQNLAEGLNGVLRVSNGHGLQLDGRNCYPKSCNPPNESGSWRVRTSSTCTENLIVSPSSSSSSSWSSVIREQAATALVIAHGSERDCNLYRLKGRPYLATESITPDRRFFVVPLPKVRNSLGQQISEQAPKLKHLKAKPYYEPERCNIQLTFHYESRPEIEQTLYLAYYLRNHSNAESTKWEHHQPFKCGQSTETGPPGTITLTVRFPGVDLDVNNESSLFMLTCRLDSSALGTTPFTPPIAVQLGREVAGRPTNADLSFFSKHLKNTRESHEGGAEDAATEVIELLED